MEEKFEWRIDLENNIFIRFANHAFIGGAASLPITSIFAYVISFELYMHPNFTLHNVLYGVLISITILVVSIPFLIVGRELRLGRIPLQSVIFDSDSSTGESLVERYSRVYNFRKLIFIILSCSSISMILYLLYGWLFVGFVLALMVPLPIASVFTTWGQIDPETSRMMYTSEELPFEHVDKIVSFRMGDTFISIIRYTSGAEGSVAPTVLTFNQTAFELFQQIVDESDTEGSVRTVEDRIIMIISFGFALLFFAIATGIWLISEIPIAVSLYISVMSGVFGAIFLWMTWHHFSLPQFGTFSDK